MTRHGYVFVRPFFSASTIKRIDYAGYHNANDSKSVIAKAKAFEQTDAILVLMRHMRIHKYQKVFRDLKYRITRKAHSYHFPLSLVCVACKYFNALYSAAFCINYRFLLSFFSSVSTQSVSVCLYVNIFQNECPLCI